MRLAFEIARHRHAERGGNRGGGMRRAEGVVVALAALGEAGETAGLAQRADAVAPSGQDLVRIGLMAHVPDQPVAWGIKDIMQRDRELDHAEAGAEMSAGDGDGVNRLLAQFGGKLRQLRGIKLAQVVRRPHLVEEGFVGHGGVLTLTAATRPEISPIPETYTHRAQGATKQPKAADLRPI